MAHLYDPNHGGEFHLIGAAVKHTSRQSSEACPRAHCTNEDTDASSILLAAWTGAFLLVAFIIPCSRYLSHRVTKIPAVSFAFWLILIVLTFIFRGSAILNTTIFTNAILRGYRIVSVAIIGCVGMVAYTIYLFTDKRKLLNGLIMVNQLRDCEDEHIKSSQGDTISATANNEKLAHEIGKRYPHFHSHQNVLSIEHEQTNAVAERNSREADEGYLINIIAWLTIPLAVADSVFIFLPILLNSTGSCNSTSVTTTAAPHTAAPGHHERSVNHSEVPHSVHPTSAEVHATTAPSDLCIRNLPLFYAGAIIFTVQKLIQGNLYSHSSSGLLNFIHAFH
ncbi:uncharacterized protein TRIADDRAFT_52283 [Trichoplax adhaerens]|uniref:Uncharacterized protein n=1 Tax=Trichoplax adhaerens TaxID=10228 RepID=B3RM96_TRIAD|nr:predicted protein [Trichoplax adhaerens]EDV29661.1 predicted protein [Trichoplax adhaerens]|eukprot:XP_002108863.1 predicted protein [Trichoplax adhaerens]